jgi:predicted DNA-binding transcriptional regulator YafY
MEYKKGTKLRARFAMLDHQLRWYDGFNVNYIADQLNITRQNASLLVQQYKEARPDETIEYDKSEKRYITGPGYKKSPSTLETQLFLDLIRGQELIRRYRFSEEWDPMDDIYFMDLDMYGCPSPDYNIVKIVMLGLTKKKILKIRYQSRRKDSERLISPNRLVYVVDRYHLRAFCHTTSSYRDFVLTRIYDGEVIDPRTQNQDSLIRWVSEDKDKAWHTEIALRFSPNPELPKNVINTLKRDYPVVKGVLTIKCNEATAPYLEMKFARPDFKYRIPQWVKIEEE